MKTRSMVALAATALVGAVVVAGAVSAQVSTPSAEVCAEVEGLGAAVDGVEGNTFEEFRVATASVRSELKALQDAAGGQYTEALDAFGRALTLLEVTVAAGGADATAIINLSNSANDLVAAYDVLEAQIGCSGTDGNGASSTTGGSSTSASTAAPVATATTTTTVAATTTVGQVETASESDGDLAVTGSGEGLAVALVAALLLIAIGLLLLSSAGPAYRRLALSWVGLPRSVDDILPRRRR